VEPIAQCRGYCARISAAPRFGAVGFVNSKSMEGVSGSDEMAGLREGMGWGSRRGMRWVRCGESRSGGGKEVSR